MAVDAQCDQPLDRQRRVLFSVLVFSSCSSVRDLRCHGHRVRSGEAGSEGTGTDTADVPARPKKKRRKKGKGKAEKQRAADSNPTDSESGVSTVTTADEADADADADGEVVTPMTSVDEEGASSAAGEAVTEHPYTEPKLGFEIVSAQAPEDLNTAEPLAETWAKKVASGEIVLEKPKKKKKKKKKKKQKAVLPDDASATAAADDTVPAETTEAESEAPVEADVTAWEPFGLSEPVLKGLAALGFSTPTPIQESAVPAALVRRKDVFAAAETGSGKTLAFGLPILARLSEEKRNGTLPPGLRALIITPTRELAIQVKDHLKAVSTFTGLTIAVIVGGLAQAKQNRVLAAQPEVIVATPGRLWELCTMGEHLSGRQLSRLSFLVVDEADRMIERGTSWISGCLHVCGCVCVC